MRSCRLFLKLVIVWFHGTEQANVVVTSQACKATFSASLKQIWYRQSQVNHQSHCKQAVNKVQKYCFSLCNGTVWWYGGPYGTNFSLLPLCTSLSYKGALAARVSPSGATSAGECRTKSAVFYVSVVVYGVTDLLRLLENSHRHETLGK